MLLLILRWSFIVNNDSSDAPCDRFCDFWIGGEVKVRHITLTFTTPITPEEVEKLVEGRESLKIWGNPIRLGPAKFHIYGVHLQHWWPMSVEITGRDILIIIHEQHSEDHLKEWVNMLKEKAGADDVWIGPVGTIPIGRVE